MYYGLFFLRSWEVVFFLVKIFLGFSFCIFWVVFVGFGAVSLQGLGFGVRIFLGLKFFRV